MDVVAPQDQLANVVARRLDMVGDLVDIVGSVPSRTLQASELVAAVRKYSSAAATEAALRGAAKAGLGGFK